MPSAALPSLLRAAKWRKSSHSNPSGNCVEIARLPGQRVAVRDSWRPDGPSLLFSQAAWEIFLGSLREGASELTGGGWGARRGTRGRLIGADGLQRFAAFCG
jgi:Domain of unknown function (DUF397)